jgi:hypothetical protein
MFSIVSYIAKRSDLQLFLGLNRTSHITPSDCSMTTNRMNARRSLCSVLLSISEFNHTVTVTYTFSMYAGCPIIYGVLQRPKGEMNTNVPTEPFTDTDLNKGAPAGKQHVEGGGTRDRSIFVW